MEKTAVGVEFSIDQTDRKLSLEAIVKERIGPLGWIIVLQMIQKNLINKHFDAIKVANLSEEMKAHLSREIMTFFNSREEIEGLIFQVLSRVHEVEEILSPHLELFSADVPDLPVGGKLLN